MHPDGVLLLGDAVSQPLVGYLQGFIITLFHWLRFLRVAFRGHL